MVIAHISDIHFGRIAQPGIVEHLVEEINAKSVDVVAVSGDLTQRARTAEFEAAAAMLAAFRPPAVVVPGNHDVYPLWRPFGRLTRPLRRYKRHITHNLFPTFEAEQMAVLGISSAYGRTVKGGKVSGAERETVQRFFARQERAVFKVLVVHHHLAQIQALAPHDVARHARRTLGAASSVGVDLILCGHLHISHVEPLELVPDRHRIVIASAGTATSNRGRGDYAETNFYNLIDVQPDHFVIEERRYEAAARAFATHGSTRFERTFEVG